MLHCTGDEDRTTQSLRRTALSRALAVDEDLMVDFTGLGFADTSLMLDLAMVAGRVRAAGFTTRLRGATPQIERLIETVGLDRIDGVELLRTPTGTS
ncbi:unannotated protein [freshwater metagenome]|uniref:Unannotated protein n=1 Tax=freshwater metagenome TaxID=449393 RepID=A0A6J7JPS7_9ZZZZ